MAMGGTAHQQSGRIVSSGATDLLKSHLVIDHGSGVTSTAQRHGSRLSGSLIIVEPSLFQEEYCMKLETFVELEGGLFRRIQSLEPKERDDSRYRQILAIPTEKELSSSADRPQLWAFSNGDIPDWYRQHGLESARIEIHTDEYIFRSTTSDSDEPILDMLPHLELGRRKDTRRRLEYFARLAVQYYATMENKPARGSVSQLVGYIIEQSKQSAVADEVKWGQKGVRPFCDKYSTILDSLAPQLKNARYKKEKAEGASGDQSVPANKKRSASTKAISSDPPSKRAREEPSDDQGYHLDTLATLASKETYSDTTPPRDHGKSTSHLVTTVSLDHSTLGAQTTLVSTSGTASPDPTATSAVSVDTSDTGLILPIPISTRHHSPPEDFPTADHNTDAMSSAPSVSKQRNQWVEIRPRRPKTVAMRKQEHKDDTKDCVVGNQDKKEDYGDDVQDQGGMMSPIQEENEGQTFGTSPSNPVIAARSTSALARSTSNQYTESGSHSEDYETPSIEPQGASYDHASSPRATEVASDSRASSVASSLPSAISTRPGSIVLAPSSLVGSWIRRGRLGHRWLHDQLDSLLDLHTTCLMVAGNDEAEAESVLERLEDGWWIPNLDRDVSRSSDPDHQNLVKFVEELADYMRQTGVQGRLKHSGDIFRSWPGPP